MKKVLYIATTADNRNRLDGETIKCRLLRDYLNGIEKIQVISIDTDNWQKHIFKLVTSIIFHFFRCDEIIISSADRGAHIVLDFFQKIRSKKRIYYFVIGGSLYRNIKERKWNINTYKRLKPIYVEADTLKKDLNSLDINNVKVLNNFRNPKNFKNCYKKTNAVKFVYFGRVIKQKGIEEAIKLINGLNKENIKCSLDIYGQCDDDYLKIIKKEFSSAIKYHGAIVPDNQHEYEILSQYDIFIFPTEYPGECLPGALIDCYIAGLAVLVSNWKYAKEYVDDEKNGYIFEYKNYKDMYNKAKKMIVSNGINKFKEHSKKISEKYVIENILYDFKNVIKGEKNEQNKTWF